MHLETKELFLKIQDRIQKLPLNEFLLSAQEETQLRHKQIDEILAKELQPHHSNTQNRILGEMNGWGPLQLLMDDLEITEILINGADSIWYEKHGQLNVHDDCFYSDISFRNCMERMCQEAKTHLTVENPYSEGKFLDFRLTAIGAELSGSQTHVSLRRHPKNPWTFAKLQARDWCNEEQTQILQRLIADRKNFLVVGSTGSGKTSVLNAFLNLCAAHDRAVVIEDTPEIALPNAASMKLLTRDDPHKVLSSIDQTFLLKRALRLRPDRLVMGEVRGAEAKDFLMALATGHAGSFGTLHAQTAAQALIRLEMLIQMGAPQWGLTAIRRLVQLSLDYVIVVGRNHQGQRRLEGIYRLCSLEEHGFLLEAVDS